MWPNLLVLLFTAVTRCSGACTYPSDLTGEWDSTSFGTLTFTSASFSGFSSAISAVPLTFTCDQSSGSQYVSKSFVTFGGLTVDVYLCMNFVKISAIKYYFTLDSNRDTGTGIRFYTSSGTNVSLSEACTYTNTRTGGEYELLILKANISDAFITCPGHLHSLFDVTMTTGSVSNCNGTSLDGRSTTALVFNYSSCVTGHFNSGGYLTCLYFQSSGYAYVNVYNNDSTVDGTTTYRFTCITYAQDDAILVATESPGSCDFTQTPTSVDSPGVTYVMTDLLYEEEKSNTVIIIAVVCSVAFVIIIIIVVVIYCKVCRKSPPPPPKERKRKRKPSITDYTPRLTRSGSVEKDLQVKKKSAVEILNETLTDKKDAVIDGDSYEPPPKKVWQKNWETKMRPPTPGRKSSQQGTTPFESLNKSTRSASLPENLDKKTETQLKAEPATSSSLQNLPYSERAHAVSRVPESTGKFGNSPKPRIQESLISGLDTTLDTIKENPLSRESTATNLNRPLETRQTGDAAMSVRTDNRSLLSTALTTSTLSARDIYLNSHSNLSRSTRFSSSTASIFEDPTWLNENTKKTDSFFDVLKNLIPGLPKKQVKDQQWFTKSQPRPEITREDIEYFRNRNKRSIGINGVDKTRSLSSLSIIEREKKRGKLKRTKIQPKIDWQYKWEHFLRPKSPFTAFFRRRRTKVRELKSAPPTIGPRPNTEADKDSLDVNTTVDIPGTTTVQIVVTLDKDSSEAIKSSQDTASYQGIPDSYEQIQATEDWQETQSLNLELSHDQKQARKRAFSEAFQNDNSTDPQSKDSPKQFRGGEKDENGTVSLKTSGCFTVMDETATVDAITVSDETGSDSGIDQYIIDCLSDTASIQSGLFYPEDWILGEEDDRRSVDILKRGSKFLSRTRNRESKRDLKEWWSTEWGIVHKK